MVAVAYVHSTERISSPNLADILDCPKLVGLKVRFRNVLSWVGGLVAFAVINIAGLAMANLLRIPTYIDYGETLTVTRGSGPAAYEEEVSGATTGIGFTIIALSIMISVRVGMAISAGRIDGGMSAEGRIDFWAWIWGIVAYGTGTLLLDKTFGYADGWHQFVRGIVEVALLVSIFCLFGSWRNRRRSLLG